MTDRCESNGNDYLSDFNTLETMYLHSHIQSSVTSRMKINVSRFMIKLDLLTWTPCWTMDPARLKSLDTPRNLGEKNDWRYGYSNVS